MSTLMEILIAAVLVSVMMTGLWAVHFRLGNAAVVDVGWPAGIALLALLLAALHAPPTLPALVVTGATVAWGVRLGGYVYTTRIRGGVPEEGRYRQLREEWGAAFARRLFGFFQLQALLVLVFALPAYLVARAPDTAFGGWLAVGFAVWAVGFVGESVADEQLRRFKADPHHAGRVCRVGLWRYSRHPNYFFEWLVWVGFALMAIQAPWGWLALFCPALLLFFLFRVTGIPATEAQALRSKGEAYRQYQRTTSAFVPWIPGRQPAGAAADDTRFHA